MAFDTGLADRVRALLPGSARIDERKMFGGLSFLVDGNMAVGVSGDELLVRIGPGSSLDPAAGQYARQMVMSGRPMAGWVFVEKAGFGDEDSLRAWVALGVALAQSVPAKQPGAAGRKGASTRTD
ncbi:MAG: TfoX/Sxy family protein [Dehalococcoidia bacterium]